MLLRIAACLAAAILFAHGRAASQTDDGETVLFSADEVVRATPDAPIIARGSVEAYFQGSRLRADRLIYDPATRIVIAIGRVSVTDPDGSTAFADRVELTDDFRDGLAEGFDAVLADNGRLAAARAVRRGATRNELDRAVYSACEVCRDDGSVMTPTWRIKALRVVQDTERKVIRYRHALLEIKGVPIFYMPYFQIPDPSVERQSGFLPPQIGQNDRIGLFADIPYYFALSDHYDATLMPKITGQDGILWQGEYRQELRRGSLAVEGGVLDFEGDTDEPGIAATRWHYFITGDYQLPWEWTAELDVERVSDDTYFRRYQVIRTGSVARLNQPPFNNRLQSFLRLSRPVGDGHAQTETFLFEGLRAADDPGLTPLAAPIFEYRQRFRDPLVGGAAAVFMNGVNLQRLDGADQRRLSTGVDWRKRFVGFGGQVMQFSADVRGDVFVLDDLGLGVESGPVASDENDAVVARFAPTVSADWSWPFARSGRGPDVIIEPRVQLITSYDTAEDEFLLNEDSRSVEFDATNLFVRNKSPGYDLFETGPRANVGVEIAARFGPSLSASAMIGQQVRLTAEDAFAANNGLDGRRSDFVSGVEVNLRRWLRASARARFDERTGQIRRNDAAVRTTIGPVTAAAEYARLISPDDAEGEENFDESLNARLTLRVTKNWALTGQTQEDLDESRTIRQRFGVIYRDNCSSFSVLYQRDGVRDRDLRPSSAILFTFSLDTIAPS